MFGTTLNCFTKFILKANLAFDLKGWSELPKNKQIFFTHIYKLLGNHFHKQVFTS